jgi:dolichyl-phosphate-mannose--protein O-mannosyl transferase
MACLALALDELWAKGGHWRWTALAPLVIAAGMFVWFYPIISAGALHEGRNSFLHWMWLRSWR